MSFSLLIEQYTMDLVADYPLDFEHRTTLAWDPCSETFTIHRPPVDNPAINHGYETAPHTLFTSVDDRGREKEETLQIHAFFDRSVLEVFVNDRTVITTRIYHPSEQFFGARFFAETSTAVSQQDQSILLRTEAWDGLGC